MVIPIKIAVMAADIFFGVHILTYWHVVINGTTAPTMHLSLCVLGTIAQGLSECGTYELDFQASLYKEDAISFL